MDGKSNKAAILQNEIESVNKERICDMNEPIKSDAGTKISMYVKICERAEQIGICNSDRVGALMDIESADRAFNLRLDEWLAADAFDFAHDFCGIQGNIVRGKFPAVSFGLFVPRFASAAG